LVPAAAYAHAQRFRAWYRARVAEVFRDVDVLLAPTTPYSAPPIGAPSTTTVDGVLVSTRSHLGVFTQPLSFIGLPVISVPIVTPGALPLGVQLVAAPFRESALVRAAAIPPASSQADPRHVPATSVDALDGEAAGVERVRALVRAHPMATVKTVATMTRVVNIRCAMASVLQTSYRAIGVPAVEFLYDL